MRKKGQFEFSFAWIFAIIAGVFILGLAIYFVVTVSNIHKEKINTETAVTMGVLTNPLESSFESAKRVQINTEGETRILLRCENQSTYSNSFGKQLIKTSEKSLNEWSDENGKEASFQNKYFFSKNSIEGKKFYLFSKPFEMPFKISDLIIVTSSRDKYCFVDSIEDVEEEIEDLITETPDESENFILTDRITECPEGSTTICFNPTNNCDVYVSSDYVQKKNERVYYYGESLMYAAVFSDKKTYECQLDRLMNRAETLFEIYQDKADFVLQSSECNSNLDMELIQMLNLIRGYENSEDISVIFNLAEQIDDINEDLNEESDCPLW